MLLGHVSTICLSYSIAKIPHNHLTGALAGPHLRRVTATLQVNKAAEILHVYVALETVAINGLLGGVEGAGHGFKYST